MADWLVRCTRCAEAYPAESLQWRCPRCGGVLTLDPPLSLDPAAVVRDDPTLWRYTPALPVARPSQTLGEGMTPLLPFSLDGHAVWLKLDFLQPTGSFKDRGAAVVVAALAAAGVRRVVVDSSGNAAAAFAAYAALHGLELVVFAPASTAPEKLLQARAYGAQVELVTGTRDEVAAAAQRAAQLAGTAYASHNWHPFFVEGTKTWLLEVYEQLGGQWPAACFVPVGGGSLLLGAALAVQALGGRGPVLVAAQPEACAPLAQAWARGATHVEPVRPGETVAEGAQIGAPPRGDLLLAVLQQSGGWPEAVPEALLWDTTRELWRGGLYVEPTAALGAAAFRLALRRGWTPDRPVVIVLTGTGLKTASVNRQLLERA